MPIRRRRSDAPVERETLGIGIALLADEYGRALVTRQAKGEFALPTVVARHDGELLLPAVIRATEALGLRAPWEDWRWLGTLMLTRPPLTRESAGASVTESVYGRSLLPRETSEPFLREHRARLLAPQQLEEQLQLTDHEIDFVLKSLYNLQPPQPA
jgi:hypothetical protein